MQREGGVSLARWKELCMDTADGEALGRFWADAGGLEFRPDGAAGDLRGATEGHGIAMCQVPEAKTVKHRVHLDVYSSSLEALTDRGATVVLPAQESGFPWTVLTDPEGGEFCSFSWEGHLAQWEELQVADASPELPDYRIHGLVVDSADPASIARWWYEVLGGELCTDDEQGWWWLEKVPGMPMLSMDFVPVPEPKTVKNRIHWDVYGATDELRERGATLLRARDEEIRWDVLADPEGNEFCVFAS
jgi:hypothetical protein